jgi:hypothetical protein
MNELRVVCSHDEEVSCASTPPPIPPAAPDCAQPQQPVACERVCCSKEALRDLQSLLRVFCCVIVLMAEQQQQRSLVVQLTQLWPANMQQDVAAMCSSTCRWFCAFQLQLQQTSHTCSSACAHALCKCQSRTRAAGNAQLRAANALLLPEMLPSQSNCDPYIGLLQSSSAHLSGKVLVSRSMPCCCCGHFTASAAYNQGTPTPWTTILSRPPIWEGACEQVYALLQHLRGLLQPALLHKPHRSVNKLVH